MPQSPLLNFQPTTSGERLFQFILKELHPGQSHNEIQSLGVLTVGGRGDFFADYILGVSTINMTARLVKKALKVRAGDDELTHQSEMVRYIQQTLGVNRHSGDDVVDRLASHALAAASTCGRRINESAKKIVQSRRIESACYICGTNCLFKSTDEKAQVKYEHLWPSSYGGDSVHQNLIPCCWHCNEVKDDMLLWHTGGLFSFVLKPSPSLEEIKAISRREKVAMYMRLVLQHACLNRCSLKEAAMAIGPVSMTSIYAIDDADAIDFSNFEFR